MSLNSTIFRYLEIIFIVFLFFSLFQECSIVNTLVGHLESLTISGLGLDGDLERLWWKFFNHVNSDLSEISQEQLWLLDTSASRGRQSVAKMMTPLCVLCIQLSESSSGVIKDKEASLFLVLDHTGHRVRRLTRAAGRLTVQSPPGSSLGTWSVSMGFRLLPPTKRFTFWVGTPHGAILPWARYYRIDPLGLNQNARWTDLLLATGLTGQLRKGQFSSHRSTDRCTLNIHQSHRDPVIPVPVRPVPGTGTR